MALGEFEAMYASLEASLAASRAQIEQHPEGPEIPMSVSKQEKHKPPVITLPTTHGGVDATITVKATAMTDTNHANRLEIALDRPDIGRVSRTAVCQNPVEIRPGGIYIKERNGRSFVDRALDLARVFSGNRADQKYLRARGLGFI